jgi:hypothetical protein
VLSISVNRQYDENVLSVQLLDLVGGWACDTEVVLLAAPALQAVLATAPFLTAATFAKFDVLAVLAAAAVKQAEAAAAAKVLYCPQIVCQPVARSWFTRCSLALTMPQTTWFAAP